MVVYINNYKKAAFIATFHFANCLYYPSGQPILVAAIKPEVHKCAQKKKE